MKESKNTPNRTHGPSPGALDVETLRMDEESTLQYVGKGSI
jgi:hypothetical protein